MTVRKLLSGGDGDWLTGGVVASDLFREQPTLVGARLRLEPLTVDVLDEYWAALHDPEVRRLTGTHATFTRDQIEEWLRTRQDHHDRADWAAIGFADGSYLGEVVINDLDPVNESASFRIALASSELFGRGIGTEMTQLVVRHAFAIGLHRLALEVFAFNERAVHVYERCGFVHEGRLRDALLWEGLRYDALVMAALRTDSLPLATER